MASSTPPAAAAAAVAATATASTPTETATATPTETPTETPAETAPDTQKTVVERRRVLEGIFAVNKPQWASSAGVLRDLQNHFARSSLFSPWLEAQRRQLFISGARQKHIDQLKVKLGHGGTLDPLATGVLIVGVGRGTKHLGRFLECTKSYECVVLFGAATDSYDAVGKLVSTADYAHVTKDLVEEKLAHFRGNIMQKPSVFSALKVDGKKMYEYAREGKDIPNVAARPVEVKELELVEWLEPGSHDYAWPTDELDSNSKAGAQTLLGIRPQDAAAANSRSRKRSRSPTDPAADAPPATKPRTEEVQSANDVQPPDNVQITGLLPLQDVPEAAGPIEEEPAATVDQAEALDKTETSAAPPETNVDPANETTSHTIPPPKVSPPAARLRMTVTSGFYVRSLCHDLGLACGSLGLMSVLVRSRQADYKLGENVLEFSDLEKGAEAWEPTIQRELEAYMQKEGWQVEELESDEAWAERKKEVAEQRKDGDRDRSYRGGRGGRGKWRGGGGGGGGGKYSKDMRGGRND